MEGIKHTLNGRINDQGHLLLNTQELHELVRLYRNKQAIITIEILDAGDVEVMRALYRNGWLPKIVTAWRELGEHYTPEQADRELVRLTTTRKMVRSGDDYFIARIEELDREYLKRWLDEVALICSIHLNLAL